MKKKVIEIIEEYNMIEENSNIIVGLSGGADSVSLFHILLDYNKNNKFNIIPVHINHGVRGAESDRDEKFVIDLCKKNNLKCKVYKCNINQLSKELKITEEEAGRKFRYESFRQEYKDNIVNKIAVAHTKNDQSETVLMRIFRGSGLKGLCGIDIVNEDIIRPLLTSSREEVEKYCDENNLKYINDSTNKKTIYTRNKIRLELIPYIEKNFNKNIVNTLCKTSDILREEENYIDSQVLENYNMIANESDGEIVLNISLLKTNHIVIVKRIIRKAFLNLNNNLVNLNSKHINSIVKLIYGNSGKKVNLPFHITVKVSYDHLIFTKKDLPIVDESFFYELKENFSIYVKEGNFYVTMSKDILNYNENKNNTYTKIFYYDNINGSFCVRSRKSGDKIFLNHINGSKKIKNYFIDEKIDIKYRSKIPMLAIDNEILWIFDKNNLTNDKYIDIKKNKVVIQLWED